MLWFCFTLSGAAALALEQLWMRSAALVLGQTAVTTATVLAVYFGGLAGGAFAARGIRQRAAQSYGLLELGVAVGAAWSVAAFRILSTDATQGYLTVVGTAGRVGAVALAILPATLCCGATLPAIGQALGGASNLRGRGALLYALNTLGGALGIAVAGFGLPALVGVSASYAIAAGGSVIAGGLALASAQDANTQTNAAGSESVAGHATNRRAPLAIDTVSRSRLRTVAAGGGALALGLEVLWTRLFAQVLHNSVYSFSAIALVFLLAIALGATLAALLLSRTAATVIAGSALVGAAATTVGGVWLFVRWTDGLAYVGMQSGLGEYLFRIVALAAATAGPAAVASGIVLPTLWAAWGNTEGAARPLGDLSAANMCGGVVGAVAAGFIVIPLLGMRGAFFTTAIAYLILADIIFPRGRERALGYVALLGIVVANPMYTPLVHLGHGDEALRATIEGPSGVVTVVDSDSDLQLRFDNYYVLGGTAAATNERRLGLLPLLLHPNPKRVAFIGLATGITASAGPALGVGETTIAEVVPEVATAARAHFGTWNAHLLDRSDVHLVLEDGRRYLGATLDEFDVIVSDLFIPWHAGAGNLYSREMYATVARRLAPGGLFCQWLPLYQLTREEFDLIVRTFRTVFPRASLWRADFYPDRPVVGLVGHLSAERIDLARVAERLSQLPDWARDPLLVTPRGLAMLSVGDLDPIADLFAGSTINTDDRPLLEFLAPRLTRINAEGDKDWLTGQALATLYDTIEQRRAATSDALLPDSTEVADAKHAGMLLYRYALAATRKDERTAARLEREVRALVPDVIVGAEAIGTDTSDARRELAGLRTEQDTVRRRLEEMERRLGALTSGKAVE